MHFAFQGRCRGSWSLCLLSLTRLKQTGSSLEVRLVMLIWKIIGSRSSLLIWKTKKWFEGKDLNWYVNGLNLVLSPWLPFFDPYSTCI